MISPSPATPPTVDARGKPRNTASSRLQEGLHKSPAVMKLVERLMEASPASSAPQQTFGIAIYRPNSPKPLKGLNHLRRRRRLMIYGLAY
jgi:hypothetical protein